MSSIDDRIAKFADKQAAHDEKIRLDKEAEAERLRNAQAEQNEKRTTWLLKREDLQVAINELNAKIVKLDRRFQISHEINRSNEYTGHGNNQKFPGIERLQILLLSANNADQFACATIIVSRIGLVQFRDTGHRVDSMTVETVNKEVFTDHLLSMLENSRFEPTASV